MVRAPREFWPSGLLNTAWRSRRTRPGVELKLSSRQESVVITRHHTEARCLFNLRGGATCRKFPSATGISKEANVVPPGARGGLARRIRMRNFPSPSGCGGGPTPLRLPDQDYWAANPPGRRRFMTRDELLARAGAAQADLDKVTTFVRSHGFEVMEISVARRTARVSGTVAQANSAFAVDLGRYESPEESYRGREGSIYLPNDVADVVHGIFGLDNRRMARRHGTYGASGRGRLDANTSRCALQVPTAQSGGSNDRHSRVRRRLRSK